MCYFGSERSRKELIISGFKQIVPAISKPIKIRSATVPPPTKPQECSNPLN